ncbi:patatin-like phospholipase family protein [Paraglaciecola aquimarina]|uniref:Patatin-like phospholipase family protein n=1 Tax=Paraglaciecola algarum TaxID=3050085 RepID=A0ABS9D3Z5_9ALTE|nr:patatin-like phospholipase family protein [Paraglaciecola sp. G1-23]MCF2946747.1 patatin-like phospholipase family protein [Paraglaciecola sp. G1-23]
MRLLDIYAGKKAFMRIQQEGFSADLFDTILGASGGPKWFVLAGLDRYIFPEFFAGRAKPIHAIGSSAGAFRMACFAQQDPLAAINRLADRYSHTVYSDKPTAKEITQKGVALLDYVLGENGPEQIINNPLIKAHFIVAKCKGLTKHENKLIQMAGLGLSAGANFINRRWLDKFYQRYVFSVPNTKLKFNDPYSLSSFSAELSKQNLSQALMASGSIPVVIEGVQDIQGVPKGVYRDGGIIDYHFDLKFAPVDGLVLYPHFYSKAVPGWFDKSIKNRTPHSSSYDNVVMLVPSDEFIANLPYGKIPDRKDFETMPAEQRINYWQAVISQSDQLGQTFKDLFDKQQVVQQIKPIEFCF